MSCLLLGPQLPLPSGDVTQPHGTRCQTPAGASTKRPWYHGAVGGGEQKRVGTTGVTTQVACSPCSPAPCGVSRGRPQRPSPSLPTSSQLCFLKKETLYFTTSILSQPLNFIKRNADGSRSHSEPGLETCSCSHCRACKMLRLTARRGLEEGGRSSPTDRRSSTASEGLLPHSKMTRNEGGAAG